MQHNESINSAKKEKVLKCEKSSLGYRAYFYRTSVPVIKFYLLKIKESETYNVIVYCPSLAIVYLTTFSASFGFSGLFESFHRFGISIYLQSGPGVGLGLIK